MVNTVTQKTLFGDANTRKIVRSVNVESDGTEETDLIIYNNSDFAADVSKGRILRVWMMGSFTGSLFLSWDQTTDETAISLGQQDAYIDFRSFGGYQNPGATGATGDLFLTTRALANLDDFTLIVELDQS